ncbi:hypothetical protein HDU91_001021 [Kappamyces sp. JEL0680]|nr:hypothetical protein HDU91_001021 [Kappamyces sp. JEL0680]
MCRIWEIDPATTSAQDPIKIPLKDKGIAVEWHRNLASYILIGLQNGLVHLFNVETLSLEVEVLVPGSRPLAGLSWHPDSPNIFGAVSGSSWHLYNLEAMPYHLPEHSGEGHALDAQTGGGSTSILWCPSHSSSMQAKMFCVIASTPEGAFKAPAVLIYPNGFTKGMAVI